MNNPDDFHKCQPCDDGSADQYLGDPDQIECLLGGLCHEPKAARRERDQIGPKPREEIDSVPERPKLASKRME